MDVTEAVVDVLIDHTSMERDEIKLNSHLEDDLELNRLEISRVLDALAERFEVWTGKPRIKEVRRVQDLVDWLTPFATLALAE